MMKRFAALVLAVSLTMLASPAAAAPVTADRADAAAGWLARQLTDGERFEAEFGGVKYPDQGLTIDAVLAFAAAGVASEHADKAIAWLKQPAVLSGYAGDGNKESYAGAHAKLLLAALVQGENPADFGGVDLPARLLALQSASGRFVDKSEYGDYHNAFKQALAILALDRLPAGAPAQTVEYLAGTQCDDGGFPLYFDKPACESDLDATAVVVQALRAGGATGAADEGLAWLISQQKNNGGFGGTGSAGEPNANSTGLAAQALRAAGKDAEADRAVAFLLTLQVGCTGTAENQGAVAADANGFAKGTVVRATAGGILGLVGIGFADLNGTKASADVPALKCEAPGNGGGLPVTGTQTWLIVAVGLGLVLLGGGIVTVARRRV